MIAAIHRLIRRTVLRFQIRSLEDQAASIVDARDIAMKRLMEIRRERSIKEIELWLQDGDNMPKAA